MNDYEPGLLGDLLPLYYKKVFPSHLLYRWLNYSGVGCFQKREFSFTLKDDVYIRYLSYADQADFEKDLVKVCPYKIDIGAVFTYKPKEQRTVKPSSFKALEKELVFDIDVSDYDDVRFCCSGADICQKCWPLMAMAVQIIDRALKEDLGFEGVLWVYSGRRGVHAWVADKRDLSQQARVAIVEYLTLVKGGDKQLKKVTLKSAKLHPFISTSLKLIEERAEEYLLQQQDFLADEHKLNKLLNLLPDQLKDKVADFIQEQGAESLTSKTQWEIVKRLNEARKQELYRLQEKRSGKDVRELIRQHEHLISEIILQYCYPRLDANVSIAVNHLLKSPFCVHPKTGKVCIPFDASKAFEFDLSAVPTITDVLREHKELFHDKENINKKDVVVGCMEESVRVFKQFIEKVEEKDCRKKISLDF